MSEVHRQLYHQSAVFKAAIEACDAAAKELFGAGWSADVWKQSASSAAPNDPVLAFAVVVCDGHATTRVGFESSSGQWHWRRFLCGRRFWQAL